VVVVIVGGEAVEERRALLRQRKQVGVFVLKMFKAVSKKIASQPGTLCCDPKGHGMVVKVVLPADAIQERGVGGGRVSEQGNAAASCPQKSGTSLAAGVHVVFRTCK
jgi:hypothetical protein